MTISKSSDFTIFDDEFQSGIMEVQDQNVDAFNAAFGGAITIVTAAARGDYQKKGFFKQIDAVDTRRDLTSVSAVTPLGLTQGEQVSVKLSRKYGPVGVNVDAWKKAGLSPAEMSAQLGRDFEQHRIKSYLNHALIAVEAAIEAVAALTFDGTGTAGTTHSDLEKGLVKFGDRAGAIRMFIMHSRPHSDLKLKSISDKITNVADLVIGRDEVGALGRSILITDDSALIDTTTSESRFNILGLVPGAVTIIESEDILIHSQRNGAFENIHDIFQAEYAFNVEVRGATWDVGNGGKNPTDSALGTGSNWDKVATSNKDMPGVRIRTISSND